jgi:CO/xanthine dehydrogenase Mo-binding subunit
MLNNQANEEPKDRLYIVGKRIPILEAAAKVSGETRYVDDMTLPGMIYGKILRSPYSHAKIAEIDTRKVKSLPGVESVITWRDIPPVRYNSSERFFGQLATMPATETLLSEKARYVGDRIAAVAAVSEEAAERALELIAVRYEVLPAVFDAEEALRKEAPEIHEGGNLAKYIEKVIGNVAKGFKESDLVFEGKYKTQTVQHASIEPHGSLACFEGGRLTVFTPTQTPFPLRFILSRALELPINKIRIISTVSGGSFGGKNEVVDEVVCSLLAIKTRKPVKMIMSREEEFSCSRTRHSSVSYLKTGVKKNGILVAREMKTILNTGAYASGGPVVLAVLGSHLFQLYRIPNIRFEGHCAYTNSVIAGAMRGYGNPQGAFPGEIQLDEIAYELALDPVELRLKNAAKTGDKDPLTGISLGSIGLEECLRRGSVKIDWSRKREEYALGKGSVRHGVGMACAVHNTGTYGSPVPEFSSAIVSINEDGTVNLLTGIADLGTGSNTTLSQIVAETLGVRVEDITVTSADTDVTPIDRGVFASRGAYVGGQAARNAALEARKILLEEASKLLAADIDQLTVRNGFIRSRDILGKRISVAEVAISAITGKDAPGQIVGKATFYSTENPHSYAVHFAEVEVNTETGEIDLIKVVAAHDVGKAINPLIVEGQIEGAIAMGAGYALMEELLIDKNGCVVNGDLEEYKLVRAPEMPEVDVLLIETMEPSGPYGAKGVGEIGLVPTAPAILSAIFNATGKRFREIPLIKEELIAQRVS